MKMHDVSRQSAADTFDATPTACGMHWCTLVHANVMLTIRVQMTSVYAMLIVCHGECTVTDLVFPPANSIYH